MFDADKGRQASDKAIETASNQLAADAVDFLADPTIDTATKKKAIEEAAAIFANRSSIVSLATGTYAQNTAGQPAAALGAGGSQFDPTQITAQQALAALAGHEPRLGAVMQRMALGLQSPNAPGALVVNQNGEFAELETARREVADKERERALAVRELDEQRDPAHVGSLAHQLAAAQATPTAPADMVAKADVKTAAEAALTKVKAVKHSPMKGGAASKTEAEAATQAVIDLAS